MIELRKLIMESYVRRYLTIVPIVLVLLMVAGQSRAVAQGCSSADFKVAPTFESTVGNGYPCAGKLNQNAGNVLSAAERNTIINLFGGAADTTNITARAQAIRQVAEDTDLYNAEYNRAFVLTQYFGYLRRNPFDPQDTDYTGYDFWLTKLNQFNGNYINAEMVKAFLSSIEYRQRFGP